MGWPRTPPAPPSPTVHHKNPAVTASPSSPPDFILSSRSFSLTVLNQRRLGTDGGSDLRRCLGGGGQNRFLGGEQVGPEAGSDLRGGGVQVRRRTSTRGRRTSTRGAHCSQKDQHGGSLSPFAFNFGSPEVKPCEKMPENIAPRRGRPLGGHGNSRKQSQGNDMTKPLASRSSRSLISSGALSLLTHVIGLHRESFATSDLFERRRPAGERLKFLHRPHLLIDLNHFHTLPP